MTFNISDIARICAANLSELSDSTLAVRHFLYDSRSVGETDGTMFCALTTDSADGHSFIGEMYERGVRMFLVERVPDWFTGNTDAVFIVVDSVAEALSRLGREARARIEGTVVGITGSAGKTVVKEMIHQGLRASGLDSSRSPRSWNSTIGVPLSLLQANPADHAAIIEAGIDSIGSMQQLANIIRPEIGVLTTITEAHDAGFPSLEAKIREKALLFNGAKTIVYDAREPLSGKILAEIYPDAELIAVTETDNDATDRALAKAVLSKLGVQTDTSLDVVSNRIDVLECVNDCLLLHDRFTHDVQSIERALDFMRRRAIDRRSSTLVISDLAHGAYDEDFRTLGRLAGAFGVTRVIAIGRRLASQTSVFGPSIEVETVESAETFLRTYDINRFSSETILIAGCPADKFLDIKSSLAAARHDTIYEINLDSLVHNFNYYRTMLRPSTGVVGMVKASAYGTGALEVAKTLQAQRAAYLAVAVVDEGVELRRGGISMPIMVLNPITTNYAALFRHDLEPSIFSLRELEKLVSEARKAGIESFRAHIKLDTGMHRVGFIESDIDALTAALDASPELKVASIFSHLATADCPDEAAYTQMQLDTFERVSSAIMQRIPYPVKRHILNTAGIATHPEFQYDMVRLGIGLYGLSPLPQDQDNLQTVATLKTTIFSLKHWPAGTTIGYARRGRLDRDSVIATVPIGYADGLDRHLSRGNASFVVNGVFCPTVGNICMDQCMIDVTDVPDVKIGDEVEIFGEHQSAARLAEILDTIHYEVISTVSPRVKRIYYNS